jgi:predicted phosphodiesterase
MATMQVLRLLHVSDTHNMHAQIEEKFPFPEADILLHTGDLTDHGSMEELCAVNEYFGSLINRFQHIIVIAGNHDVHGNKGEIDIGAVLTNATVLQHEVAEAVLHEYGLKIFGSPWLPWKKASSPGGEGHRFDAIPEGQDILMTHGPAAKIFDCVGRGRWGSCQELNEAIMRARPRVHLFGHLHEQRGTWSRNADGAFVGGVEYQAVPGQPFPSPGPPPSDWPCELVSCNAMANHGGHERSHSVHIAGPARLIVAERFGGEPWQFSLG